MAFVVSETGGIHKLVSPIVSALLFSQQFAPIPVGLVGSSVCANKALVTLHMRQRCSARPSSSQLLTDTGHSYGRYGCSPVCCKESEVDNIEIIHSVTRVAPRILTRGRGTQEEQQSVSMQGECSAFSGGAKVMHL